MNRPLTGHPIILELAAREPFRLGNAVIDPVAREARWPGGDERLQPQAFKVLMALTARRGEVVTRDELVELCWDGRIVGDDVINRAISLLRPFAERAGGFSIETVPRTGYRLIEDRAGPRAKRLRWTIAASITCTMLVGAAFFTAHFAGQKRNVAARPLTVALRPFTAPPRDSVSADVALRATDATARMLTESGISVIDSSNTNGVGQADLILTGTLRPIANGHSATIRIEEPVHHVIVMNRQIETAWPDPAALPDQIGAQISAAMSTAAPLIRLDPASSSDPALLANLLNKNASSFAAQTNFEIARRTAVNEPNSIMAQLALAMRTGLTIGATPPSERAATLTAGREAAARLLRLAPHFGDAYLPWCFLHAEVRIAECEAQLEKGLSTDPRAQSVGIMLGKLLLNVGRIHEAVPLAKATLAKNPYSPTQINRLLLALDADGQTREADSAFTRGRRFWPSVPDPFFNRVSGMLARGDFDAVAKLDAQITASGTAPDYASIAGRLDRAIHLGSPSLVRESCRALPPDDDLPIIECMLASARLGDLNQAFRLADRLYPRRTGRTAAKEDSIWLADPENEDTLYLVGPGAAPLRRDSRFLTLADRVGLLRYWRAKALPNFCSLAREPICTEITRH